MQSRTITLGGIELDNPLWNPDGYRGKVAVRKDGARTSFSCLWLERYVVEEGAYCYDAHLLELSNHGACFLDGKQLKDASAVSFAKTLFAELG